MTDFYSAFEKKPPTAARWPTQGTTTHPGYANAALAAEVEAVATAVNGTRNHTLNRATFNLAQLIAGGALNEDTVIEHLTAAAQTVGLDMDEITATINSGLRAGRTHPRGAPDPDLPPPVTVIDESADCRNTRIREQFPILDWHEVWNHQDDEEWIIEPLLPARRLIALYSAPKVGKSLLMLEVAVAIARGTPVLGTKIDKPRRVLYVDFENDPYTDIRERLQAMTITPDQLDNLCYMSFPTIAYLDTEQGSLELLAATAAHDCEVVIIDTVSRAVSGEENENDTWLKFYRHTGLKLKQAGKALVRLDHSGKDETKGQRGGSAKSGDVDAIWRLSKVTDTTFRLDCENARMPVTEKTLVLHRREGPLHHMVDAEGRSAAWKAKIDAVLEVLDQAGAPKDISNSDARDLLRTAGIKVGNDPLAEALRRRKMSLSPFRDSPGTLINITPPERTQERHRNDIS